MGSNTSLAPLQAWAPRGERARCSVARNRGKNTTMLLASMMSEGMGPCVAVVGSTTAAVFEAYVERALAPALRPGQVMVLDNLGAHKKGERVRELIEGRGCELLYLLLYLPPYSSPDLNPIEETFSKVKALLRRAGARTHDALIEAIGKALDAVSTKDSRSFFEHCGYPLWVQPLWQPLPG
jgi:transposase